MEKNNDFDIKDYFGENLSFIIGKLEEQYIGIKLKYKDNLNALIAGTSGGGKTSSEIIPNLYNAIRRGDSIIGNDPKHDIFAELGETLRTYNYDTYIFDLNKPEGSSCIDILKFIDLAPGAISNFTNMIFSNLSSPKDNDNFFQEGAKNLFSYIIAVSLEHKELEKRDLLVETDRSLSEFRPGTIGYAVDLLFNNQDKYDLKTRLMRLYAGNQKYSSEISNQFYNMINVDSKNDNTGNFLSNLREIINKFLDKEYKRLFSEDEFIIDDLCVKKVACFIIMDVLGNEDKNKLASVLINTFMNRIYTLRENEYHPVNMKQRIWIMLDEFGAVGTIHGFKSVISTARSKNLTIVVAAQTMEQLRTNYPNDWGTILGNINLKICTALNDKESKDYFSSEAGKRTEIKISESKTEDKKTKSFIPIPIDLIDSEAIGKLEHQNLIIYKQSKMLLDQVRMFEINEYKTINKVSVEEFKEERRIRKLKEINNLVLKEREEL